MSKSNYLELKMLAHRYGGPDFTRPANVYFALFTQLPTDADPGVEVSGNGYVRKTMTNDNSLWGTPSAGQIQNVAAVEFAVATPSGWGTVVGVAIFDAVSGGNMLDFGALVTPRVIGAEDIPVLTAGSITVTED